MSKKIISHLFNYACQEGAKDLVIEGLPTKISLNYYFPDGEERLFSLPKKLEKDLSLALRQVLKLGSDEFLNKKYCKIEDRHYQLTFYLTISPSSAGEKIIINIIPKNKKLYRLKQLGLQSRELKTLATFVKRRSGLILISSPHGQGKGATLHALIKELNSDKHCLYYLGDSFSFELPGVNYLKATKNNWAKVLNLDSDIIISEISSENDLKNALHAATTGRLVLATISADSVWEVLLSYLKLKSPLKLKLDGLKLILNQRLAPLKRKGAKNKFSRSITRTQIGLFEILELTPTLKNFLLASEQSKQKNKFWEKLGQIAIRDGYRPLVIDYKKKIKDGLIDSK